MSSHMLPPSIQFCKFKCVLRNKACLFKKEFLAKAKGLPCGKFSFVHCPVLTPQ